ncbi:hypothetical protein SAMN02927921_01394 [Sinomicrobium oceani]|uniref:Uncharacterized protein n=1 Tax=Sinomicrobium oceani TaxID=1150368 RepID=A0A1K1NRC4_9FLAO|nr:hypothetical protein SAMN02927921_01394 [Sinomicrobium oceani]
MKSSAQTRVNLLLIQILRTNKSVARFYFVLGVYLLYTKAQLKSRLLSFIKLLYLKRPDEIFRALIRHVHSNDFNLLNE